VCSCSCCSGCLWSFCGLFLPDLDLVSIRPGLACRVGMKARSELQGISGSACRNRWDLPNWSWLLSKTVLPARRYVKPR